MAIRDLSAKLRQNSSRLFERADRMSGGVLGILRDTIHRFNRARGGEAAASMAYYAIFSLFPLLLALVGLGSFFLEESRQLEFEVYRLIQVIFPISADLIVDNIDEILEKRGAIGAIGILGLLYSASGAFTTLFHNINRAWSMAAPLNILKSRLLAVGIILVMVIVLVAVLFSSAIVNLLPAINVPYVRRDEFLQSSLWLLISNLITLVAMFLIFLFLYWWIPNTRVRWREAFWAALLAALSWYLTTRLFSWYLGSGLAGFEFVYGALSALIILLLWIYLNSGIVIFCAHLSAAIAKHTRIGLERVELEKDAVEIKLESDDVRL